MSNYSKIVKFGGIIDHVSITEQSSTSTNGLIIYVESRHMFAYQVMENLNFKYYSNWANSALYFNDDHTAPKTDVMYVNTTTNTLYKYDTDTSNLKVIKIETESVDIESLQSSIASLKSDVNMLQSEGVVVHENIIYNATSNSVGTTYVHSDVMPVAAPNTKYVMTSNITSQEGQTEAVIKLQPGSKLVPNGGIPEAKVIGGEYSWANASDLGLVQDDESLTISARKAYGVHNAEVFKKIVELSRFNIDFDGGTYLICISATDAQLNNGIIPEVSRPLYLKNGTINAPYRLLDVIAGGSIFLENLTIIHDDYGRANFSGNPSYAAIIIRPSKNKKEITYNTGIVDNVIINNCTFKGSNTITARFITTALYNLTSSTPKQNWVFPTNDNGMYSTLASVQSLLPEMLDDFYIEEYSTSSDNAVSDLYRKDYYISKSIYEKVTNVPLVRYVANTTLEADIEDADIVERLTGNAAVVKIWKTVKNEDTETIERDANNNKTYFTVSGYVKRDSNYNMYVIDYLNDDNTGPAGVTSASSLISNTSLSERYSKAATHVYGFSEMMFEESATGKYALVPTTAEEYHSHRNDTNYIKFNGHFGILKFKSMLTTSELEDENIIYLKILELNNSTEDIKYCIDNLEIKNSTFIGGSVSLSDTYYKTRCNIHNCKFLNVKTMALSIGVNNNIERLMYRWASQSVDINIDNCTFRGPDTFIPQWDCIKLGPLDGRNDYYTCGVLVEGYPSVNVYYNKFLNLISNYRETYDAYLSCREVHFQYNYSENCIAIPRWICSRAINEEDGYWSSSKITTGMTPYNEVSDNFTSTTAKTYSGITETNLKWSSFGTKLFKSKGSQYRNFSDKVFNAIMGYNPEKVVRDYSYNTFKINWETVYKITKEYIDCYFRPNMAVPSLNYQVLVYNPNSTPFENLTKLACYFSICESQASMKMDIIYEGNNIDLGEYGILGNYTPFYVSSTKSTTSNIFQRGVAYNSSYKNVFGELIVRNNTFKAKQFANKDLYTASSSSTETAAAHLFYTLNRNFEKCIIEGNTFDSIDYKGISLLNMIDSSTKPKLISVRNNLFVHCNPIITQGLQTFRNVQVSSLVIKDNIYTDCFYSASNYGTSTINKNPGGTTKSTKYFYKGCMYDGSVSTDVNADYHEYVADKEDLEFRCDQVLAATNPISYLVPKPNYGKLTVYCNKIIRPCVVDNSGNWLQNTALKFAYGPTVNKEAMTIIVLVSFTLKGKEYKKRMELTKSKFESTSLYPRIVIRDFDGRVCSKYRAFSDIKFRAIAGIPEINLMCAVDLYHANLSINSDSYSSYGVINFYTTGENATTNEGDIKFEVSCSNLDMNKILGSNGTLYSETLTPLKEFIPYGNTVPESWEDYVFDVQDNSSLQYDSEYLIGATPKLHVFTEKDNGVNLQYNNSTYTYIKEDGVSKFVKIQASAEEGSTPSTPDVIATVPVTITKGLKFAVKSNNTNVNLSLNMLESPHLYIKGYYYSGTGYYVHVVLPSAAANSYVKVTWRLPDIFSNSTAYKNYYLQKGTNLSIDHYEVNGNTLIYEGTSTPRVGTGGNRLFYSTASGEESLEPYSQWQGVLITSVFKVTASGISSFTDHNSAHEIVSIQMTHEETVNSETVEIVDKVWDFTQITSAEAVDGSFMAKDTENWQVNSGVLKLIHDSYNTTGSGTSVENLANNAEELMYNVKG